jgi:hypothetical protein
MGLWAGVAEAVQASSSVEAASPPVAVFGLRRRSGVSARTGLLRLAIHLAMWRAMRLAIRFEVGRTGPSDSAGICS